MKLLFVSNLFPSRDDPVRGLDNARLLHSLRKHCEEVRALALRPSLSPVRWFGRTKWRQRPEDSDLRPVYRAVPYVPKIGSAWNHHLMASAIASSLRKIRRDFDYDHILVSWLYPDGCAIAKLADVPFTMICQGSDAHTYLGDPVRKRAILEAVGKSQAVITRSADLAERLSEAGASRKKLHPIYNGVDTEMFHPTTDKGQALEKLGLRTDARWLLFVGNFLPVKNPKLLLEAWSEVRKALPDSDVQLAMVGAGPLEGVIRRHAEVLGLSDYLHLPGSLPSNVIADYMRAADTLCLSSINEGVPNVVLEALASGLPIVSTDVGGISEVLNQPFLGGLVKDADPKSFGAAIVDTLNAPPAQERIAQHGQQFAWGETALRYKNLLTRNG